MYLINDLVHLVGFTPRCPFLTSSCPRRPVDVPPRLHLQASFHPRHLVGSLDLTLGATSGSRTVQECLELPQGAAVEPHPDKITVGYAALGWSGFILFQSAA